jgi:hypothetical protein
MKTAFLLIPRPNVPALAQCGGSQSLRGKEQACLELLLQTAEQDLSQVYAYRFQEANDEWREYRGAGTRLRRAPRRTTCTPRAWSSSRAAARWT